MFWACYQFSDWGKIGRAVIITADADPQEKHDEWDETWPFDTLEEAKASLERSERASDFKGWDKGDYPI